MLSRIAGPLWVLSLLILFLPGSRLLAAPWRSTGPEGGFVTVLHYPLDTTDLVIAGTYGGGLYLSNDAGRSWDDITRNMTQHVVEDIVSAGSPAPRTWVATAEGTIYRSGSLAGAWDFASAGLSINGAPLRFTALAVDPTDPLKLAASAFEGLWLTETGGNRWPDSLLVLPRGTNTDVEITDSAPVIHYSAAEGRIWRSTNARDFDSRQLGLPIDYIIDLEVWPGSSDSLLVAHLDAGLYLSQDAATFQHIGPASSGANSPLLRKVTVLEESSEIVLCSERALHLTGDLGASWSILGEAGVQHPEYWCLGVIDGAEREFLVGTFGRGILRTQPAGPWVEQNSGLIATWVVDLAVNGNLVLASTRNGRLYQSQDGGESWEDVTGPLESLGIMAVTFLADGSRWLVGTLEGLWYSDDEGLSWSRPRRGYPSSQSVLELLDLPSADEELIYAGASRGVYLSRDLGEEWKKVESLPQEATFTVAGQDPLGRIWWGSNGLGLFRAEPDSSFESVDLGVGSTTARIRALAFDALSPDLVYWASVQDLYRWSAGEGSVSLSATLPEREAMDLLVLPGGVLVAGLVEEGVFASQSRGDDWVDWSEGLDPPRPRTLAYRGGSSPALLTGTFAKGVFVKDLVGTGTELTRGPRLLGPVTSHPNPFNPRTLVSFALERPSHARVEVFDQRGRRVALLHQGPLPSGEIELRWDARGQDGRSLPSGVYQVRIDAAGEKRSLPVTLLR